MPILTSIAASSAKAFGFTASTGDFFVTVEYLVIAGGASDGGTVGGGGGFKITSFTAGTGLIAFS